jgi:hypothetical protein
VCERWRKSEGKIIISKVYSVNSGYANKPIYYSYYKKKNYKIAILLERKKRLKVVKFNYYEGFVYSLRDGFI